MTMGKEKRRVKGGKKENLSPLGFEHRMLRPIERGPHPIEHGPTTEAIELPSKTSLRF